MKKIILTFLVLVLASAPLMAAEKYSRRDWRVEERGGRFFYLTNGAAFEGHEFGFFKDPEGCEDDVFWLSFSAPDEKVKYFLEQGVPISLDVGGKLYTVRPEMVSVGKTDSAYVMAFTNWIPNESVIKALKKGRSVKVKIVNSPMLEDSLGIKEDEFSLLGFIATQRKARKFCRDESQYQGD